MHKRLSYLALVLSLVFATSLRAESLGAVVVSWDIDSAKNTVTLHMANNSGKDITAYNIKIRETYGSHVNEHEFSSDTVALMFNIQESAGTPEGEQLQRRYGKNGTFAPGNHDEVIVVQPGLTDFSAVVDTVIYADKTAETTNPDGLNRLLGARAGFATTLQAGNDIIRKALANPNDPNPHETALKQIQEASSNPGALRGSAGALHEVMEDLKYAGTAAPAHGQSIRDYLNNYVAKRNERATKLLEHAKGGAQ